MGRRLAPGLVLLALLVPPGAAGGGDLTGRKQSIDARIAGLHDRIARARAREQALGGQIADVTAKIQALERQAVGVSAQLTSLEADLALHRERLARLTALYHLQTRRYQFLRRQYRLAVDRLGARMVDAYETGVPDTIDVIVSATSLSDMLDRFDYANEVGHQDDQIVRAVTQAKGEARSAQLRTGRTRSTVAAETQAVANRAQQVRAVREQLLASGHQLAIARSTKRASLSSLKSA
jgi:peptidoglycan hydrolase CwlO-like protein